MDVPTAWTGPSGHLMHGPWVPPFFRDGLAALIAELEAANPPGLANRRTAFRRQGQIMNAGTLSQAQRREAGLAQLLDQRAELLIGVMLARAGALTRMRKDTPDFECQLAGTRVRGRGDHSCAAGGSLGDA